MITIIEPSRSVKSEPRTGPLATKAAFITGAAQGMGLAIARRLLDDGAAVALFDVKETVLRMVIDELGSSRVLGLAGDVARREDVCDAVAATVERFGGLQIAVAHAGIAAVTPFLEISDHEWQRMLDINLSGAFYTMQESARAMQNGGAIVVTSSQNGVFPQYDTAHYSATKGALITLAKSASLDLSRIGVRVNAISPGFIDTPLALPLTSNATIAAGLLRTVPMRRFGESAEVAALVAFLVSDEASYITGANVVIDGGATVGMSMGETPIDLPGFRPAVGGQ